MQHFLQKKGRDEGTRILAGRGTGKSILLSRIAMHDFAVCNRGTAVYDTGHTIDNILLDIAAQPAAIRQQLWKRVRYVNMGGMDDRIIPWPILFRFANEPNAEVYERFIAAIQRVNPELVNPARQGMNAVRRVGGYVCDILLNRGLQLDSAEAIMLDKLFPEKKD